MQIVSALRARSTYSTPQAHHAIEASDLVGAERFRAVINHGTSVNVFTSSHPSVEAFQAPGDYINTFNTDRIRTLTRNLGERGEAFSLVVQEHEPEPAAAAAPIGEVHNPFAEIGRLNEPEQAEHAALQRARAHELAATPTHLTRMRIPPHDEHRDAALRFVMSESHRGPVLVEASTLAASTFAASRAGSAEPVRTFERFINVASEAGARYERGLDASEARPDSAANRPPRLDPTPSERGRAAFADGSGERGIGPEGLLRAMRNRRRPAEIDEAPRRTRPRRDDPMEE